MTLPALKTGWTSNTAVTSASLTLTKPTGAGAPAVGDLLLIIAISEDNGAAEGFSAITSESGWNHQYNYGDDVCDAYLGMYWRIANGAENATVNVPHIGGSSLVGWYTVWQNVDNSTPIHLVGTWVKASTGDLTIGGINTTVDDCVIISHYGFDGGDGGTFTITGTGWVGTKVDQLTSAVAASEASGAWAK